MDATSTSTQRAADPISDAERRLDAARARWRIEYGVASDAVRVRPRTAMLSGAAVLAVLGAGWWALSGGRPSARRGPVRGRAPAPAPPSQKLATAVQVARVLIPVAGFLNALRKLQAAPARPAEYVAPIASNEIPAASNDDDGSAAAGATTASDAPAGRLTLARVWTLVRKAVSAWIDDYAPSMGAALAYYTLFSIAPLLIIVIAVAGVVFGADAVQGQIVQQLQGLIGREGAVAIQGLIKSANEPKQGLVATIVSVVVLLIGATTVFGELQSALDRIWRVPAPAKTSGLWSLLRARLLSFGMILGMGFLLMVSLVVGAGLSAFGAWWGAAFSGWTVLLQVLNLGLSLALSTGLFAMIYKLMPRAKISWRDVWIGAAVTAALFEIGKYLIGLYLGTSAIASGFGAAGSLVVLLVWVYYSAQIFLLGAEFTWVFAHEHGSKAGTATDAAPPQVPSRSGTATANAAA